MPDRISKLSVYNSVHPLKSIELGQAGGLKGVTGEVFKVRSVNVVLTKAGGPVSLFEVLQVGEE